MIGAIKEPPLIDKDVLALRPPKSALGCYCSCFETHPSYSVHSSRLIQRLLSLWLAEKDGTIMHSSSQSTDAAHIGLATMYVPFREACPHAPFLTAPIYAL
ncbi:hypothetical protein XPA_007633 [Xanthoria parietina]